jgi:hypothetical protein
MARKGKSESDEAPASGLVDQAVVAELVARAGAQGVSLTGEARRPPVRRLELTCKIQLHR